MGDFLQIPSTEEEEREKEGKSVSAVKRKS
jgi:hypothetical protein